MRFFDIKYIMISMGLYVVPPRGFHIGSLEIAYYGLIIVFAMLVGVLLACKLCKKRGLKSDDILLLALIVLPCAIIGARIYYFIFNGTSFREFFNFQDGGLAILGGVIGGILGIIIFALIKRNFKIIIDLFDVCVPCLILGQAIGRIGCFFSQCCYGELVTNSSHCWFPLAMLVETYEGSGVYEWHYATNLYESLWNFIGFVPILFAFLKSKERFTPSAVYLIWYGLGRAVIEAFRGDSLFIGNTGIRVSQLVSIIMVIVGVVMLTINIIKRFKKAKQT